MTLSQHVEPYRTPAPLGIVTSIVIAALGGFVGGLLIEHGPTYLQVHVAQPVLGQPAEPSELGSAPVPADTNRYPEPTTVATPGPTEPHVVASGAESRIVV
ncbi:MAG: hypothetical protein GY811_10410, partial [Myxococcales bacterium]|nr:hypothetical protein [Myxococcales bacterium]